MFFKKLFLTTVFLISAFLSRAQNTSDCEQTLSQATLEFTEGHFYGVPSLLKPCLNKFTNEQSIRAYMLLTQVYLVIDDPIGAEESYLKLLRANPEFVATQDKDPIDVVYLSKKFTTRPIFTPRFIVGANASLSRTIQEITSDPTSIPAKQKFGIGYQLGAGLDFNFDDHWSICFDALYGAKSFETSKTGISIRDDQKIVESQTWLDVPVYVKYSVDFGKLKPYGYLGLGANILLNATGTANYTNNSESGSQSPTDGTIPLLYKRNTFNRSVVLGIGMRYKLNKNFISIDIRYMNGLTNMTKINNNYYNSGSVDLSTSITQFRWIGDLFKVNNLSISLGYSHPLYSPRKIKNEDNAQVFFKKFFKRKRVKKGND